MDQQVASGRYSGPDAFVADLLRTEAGMFERIRRGEPLPIDEHFDRRLGALIEEAEASGDYIEVTSEDFDSMEREAQGPLHTRKPA